MGSPEEGLSPRVRGNRLLPAVLLTVLRSIPACAGEPRETPSGPSGQKVYPRVCGGTHRYAFQRRLSLGLSPRVRGNPARPCRSTLGRAWVYPRVCGGTARSVATRRKAELQVYPRVCGGTHVLVLGNLFIEPSGLSPRVRGNLHTTRHPTVFVDGSIPACAGEPGSAPGSLLDAHLRVYPRVCGGTSSLLCEVRRRKVRGLSPRVRGNPVSPIPSSSSKIIRSIPACAGEPGGHDGRRGNLADGSIPRVCGGTA